MVEVWFMPSEKIEWKENKVLLRMVFYHILGIVIPLIILGVLLYFTISYMISSDNGDKIRVPSWDIDTCIGFLLLLAILALIPVASVMSLWDSIPKTPSQIGISPEHLYIVKRNGEKLVLPWSQIRGIEGENINGRYCKWKVSMVSGATPMIGIISTDIGREVLTYFRTNFSAYANEQKTTEDEMSRYGK